MEEGSRHCKQSDLDIIFVSTNVEVRAPAASATSRRLALGPVTSRPPLRTIHHLGFASSNPCAHHHTSLLLRARAPPQIDPA